MGERLISFLPSGDQIALEDIWVDFVHYECPNGGRSAIDPLGASLERIPISRGEIVPNKVRCPACNQKNVSQARTVTTQG